MHLRSHTSPMTSTYDIDIVFTIGDLNSEKIINEKTTQNGRHALTRSHSNKNKYLTRSRTLSPTHLPIHRHRPPPNSAHRTKEHRLSRIDFRAGRQKSRKNIPVNSKTIYEHKSSAIHVSYLSSDRPYNGFNSSLKPWRRHSTATPPPFKSNTKECNHAISTDTNAFTL